MTKILIIEDQPDVRENIQASLDLEDYETLTAADGLIGVELAQQFLPDLILCDVMMPRLDGFGVLKELRQLPATGSIPFIFLTAKADRTDLRHGMESGADDYLTKPFTLEELLNAIAVRLARQVTVNQAAHQEMDQLRQNITRALPHELLTPLNGILGTTEILRDFYDSMNKAEILSSIKDIQDSGKRLYRLVQNFLLFAELQLLEENPERIQVWKYRLAQKTETSEIIQELAQELAEQGNRLIDLHLDIENTTIDMADQDFRKVVEEMIDNAFKFSSDGTPVKIRSYCQGDRFCLEIQDQGRGMTSQQIDEIGAYMQFDRKLYEQQGSGLGLILAKRITQLYSGNFAITSTPQQGTTIHLSWTCTPV
jgi:two-component system sensor kinase